MQDKMKTVGYARVSKGEQAYTQALKHQVWRLLEAGASLVYADVASRTKDDRSALLEILRLVESGLVEKILLVRLDRITSSSGLFEQITQAVQRARVEFQILDEIIDVSSAEGEFVAGLQILFARREVQTIQLRAKRGYQYRQQQGRAHSRAPWGYQVVEGRYRFDTTPFLCLLSDRPQEDSFYSGRTKVDLAREVLDLFFECKTLRSTVRAIHARYGLQRFKASSTGNPPKFFIFDEAGIINPLQLRDPGFGRFGWTGDGLKRWLQNLVLQGHTAYGTVAEAPDGSRRRVSSADSQVRYNTHADVLLTAEQADLVAQFLAQSSVQASCWKSDRQRVYPISGLLFCGICGSKMRVQSRKRLGTPRERIWYQCKNYSEGACHHQKMIEQSKVQAQVVASLTQRAFEIVEMAGVEIIEEPAEIQHLKQQLAGLVKLGVNPALKAARQDLETQIARLSTQLQQDDLAETHLRALLGERCQDPGYWLRLSLEDRKELFQWLVNRIVATPYPEGHRLEVKLKV